MESRRGACVQKALGQEKKKAEEENKELLHQHGQKSLQRKTPTS